MARVEVSRESRVRFRARIGRHELVYDQPAAAGGTDTGPTPTDAFVASLAACVAYYATRFLARHGRSADGLRVGAEFVMAEHPSRVADIAIEISVADELPGTLAEALRAVAEHCTVHNSITLAPDVRIRVASLPGGVIDHEAALTAAKA
jgi:putative redox protein